MGLSLSQQLDAASAWAASKDRDIDRLETAVAERDALIAELVAALKELFLIVECAFAADEHLFDSTDRDNMAKAKKMIEDFAKARLTREGDTT